MAVQQYSRMAGWQYGNMAVWQYSRMKVWQNGSMAKYGRIGPRMNGSDFRMLMNPVNGAKLLLSY